MTRCSSCSHDNPDAQKFCGECGARLVLPSLSEETEARALTYTPRHLTRDVLGSRFALEGERKLVTVLFCDIANSTPLAQRVGADAMHGLLNRFFELALGEVHRFEGTINQFLGDGFMALFGAPIAHEDHARRALLAATAIQQHMREASGVAQALSEVRLRMGLNTGTVVVGKIGDNLRMDYTAIGDTTNLAARLQAFAEPGTIRVSETTRRSAEGHFTFRDIGRHALKGITTPVRIFEPVGPRSAGVGGVANVGQIASVLVGRETELAALSRALADLRECRGGIIIIRGEPGTGKSRLVAEARRSDAAKGVLWLEGRSLSFGRSLSYWPFIEILKGAFGISESESESDALHKLEAGLRTLFGDRALEIVPYIASVMVLPLTAEHDARVKFLDAQAMKRQVFLSVRQLAERVAQRQPVLVVMEDWHWVDQSSIALLEHLLPLTESLPLTFWLTTRAEPAEPAARIRMAVTTSPGLRLNEIALGPLGQEHSRALLDNLVGTGLPEAVRGQIERRTEGNPFFIEEVVRTLIDDGTLVKDGHRSDWRLAHAVTDLTIPDTVQGVILARIDRLEESVKSVLKLASVIGRSFFLRILKAIAAAADNVEHGLGHLEAAELIRLRAQVPELEYIFKHALVQEAAYGSILADRRRAIHRSVGRTIETLFADRQEEFASLLAYHYALAEDWEKAHVYLLKAGDLAGRIAADAEALEHYRQAEAMFMKVAGRELTPLQRATMDRKLGQALFGIGDYDQAVEHFTQALNCLDISYPKSRWGVRRTIAVLIAKHFLGRLWLTSRSTHKRGMMPEVAREISAICQSLAWMDYFVDEERFALDSLFELQAGELSGDPIARSRGLATLGLVLTATGGHKLARGPLAEAVAVAIASEQSAAIAPAEFFQAWFQYCRGRIDDSVKGLEQAAASYSRIGDIRGVAASSAMLCWASLFRGDFKSVSIRAKELIRQAEGARDPHAKSWLLHIQGRAEVTVGPLDLAEIHLKEVQDLSVRSSSIRMLANVRGTLGRCYLRQGRFADANKILSASVMVLNANNIRDIMAAEPRNAFAELCLMEVSKLSCGARRQSLRRARRACRIALKCTKNVQSSLAETLRLSGTLAWLSDNQHLAMKRWQRSIETAEIMKQPVECASVLHEMGERLGDSSLIEQARKVFEQTGAKVDLAFALHALARMAASEGSDIDVTLARYNETITLLAAVKAEYALGLASRERAALFAKLGRHPEAQADLIRARQCYAAVDAFAEKIEVEKLASDLS